MLHKDGLELEVVLAKGGPRISRWFRDFEVFASLFLKYNKNILKPRRWSVARSCDGLKVGRRLLLILVHRLHP